MNVFFFCTIPSKLFLENLLKTFEFLQVSRQNHFGNFLPMNLQCSQANYSKNAPIDLWDFPSLQAFLPRSLLFVVKSEDLLFSLGLLGGIKFRLLFSWRESSIEKLGESLLDCSEGLFKGFFVSASVMIIFGLAFLFFSSVTYPPLKMADSLQLNDKYFFLNIFFL